MNYDFSPRINVPTKIEDWTENSCASAFSALAEAPLTKVEAEARSDGPPQFRSVLYPIHSIGLLPKSSFGGLRCAGLMFRDLGNNQKLQWQTVAIYEIVVLKVLKRIGEDSACYEMAGGDLPR